MSAPDDLAIDFGEVARAAQDIAQEHPVHVLSSLADQACRSCGRLHPTAAAR